MNLIDTPIGTGVLIQQSGHMPESATFTGHAPTPSGLVTWFKTESGAHVSGDDCSYKGINLKPYFELNYTDSNDYDLEEMFGPGTTHESLRELMKSGPVLLIDGNAVVAL